MDIFTVPFANSTAGNNSGLTSTTISRSITIGAQIQVSNATELGFITAQSPNEVTDVGLLELSSAHIIRVRFYFFSHLHDGDAVIIKFQGGDHHLVLLLESAIRGHLAHPWHGLQCETDVPILQCPQFAQIITGCIKRVPIDMPQTSSVGAEGGRYAFGEQALRVIQAFQHAGSRPINVHGIFKYHEHKTHPEHTVGPDIFNFRNALQVADQRVRNLVLYDLRAAAHPFAEDDDLVLRQVGNGIHRRILHRVNAISENSPGNQENDEAVF